MLVGYGIAHMSLLLALSKSSIPLKVCVIDPYFDGGDLLRSWASIHSNTTWQQFLDAIQPYVSKVKYESLCGVQNPEKTVVLADLVRHYNLIVKSAVPEVSKVYGKVVRADFAGGNWTLTVDTGAAPQPQVTGKVLSYSPGSEPRSLNYAKPTLTLQSVLTCGRLHATVKPGDRVVVFGLAHSGTLAIGALAGCGAHVTAIYRGSAPFEFARDGHYNGIKQESAAIADRYLEGKYLDFVKVVSADAHDQVFNALIAADWVVYATGFEPRAEVDFYVDGAQQPRPTYNAITGELSVPSAFGFGIAYPNSNEVDGKTYYDVSLGAFLAHCEKNVNRLLAAAGAPTPN